MKRRLPVITLFCFLPLFGITHADTIKVPVGQQGIQDIQTPKQGMIKSDVKSSFGEPTDWYAAVGEPPISKWVYQGFTVYFEWDRVIHSVITPSR